jgi:WD40 repeat protein
MTKTERTCPRCGLVFASEKLDGLCPSCLLDSLFSEADLDDSKAFWEECGGDTEATSSSPSTAPVRRFSHFELLEELGRGGMGIVYRARDVGTGRIVALKVLQAHHLEVPDLVLRFRSEVRAVTSLDHPHVLPVHEVGEYEGIPFFSMKLTTGGSLAQRVGDYLGNPTETARLLAKVARGVAHAHERGILHRDLKPGNILLDASGEPFVCDFGLAKWIEDDRNLTITSAVLGTPHYIAPEQASGQKGLTTAADIYSLGAIIYELLTARPPFVGQSIIETLRLASENTPERPSSLAQNIPKDLETICLKCLEREPASRYPSAAALATDLENWIEGRPILARPVGAAEQLWRWARRNPLPAALIASVAMLLAATAVVATVSAVRIEKARDRAVAAEALSKSAERQARSAEAEAREKLYESLLAQARASLLTDQAGHSLDAIKALRDASEIHSTTELKNLAIRALSLTDIKVDDVVYDIGPNSRPVRSFDSKLEHIAEETGKGVVRILRLKDAYEIARFSDVGDHSTLLDRIIYSPNDAFVAVRHNDGTIKVWDVKSQKKQYEVISAQIEKAPWYAPNFAFTTDCAKFAAALPDGGVGLYDARTGAVRLVISAPDIVRCVAISPDGTLIALATYRKNDLHIFDSQTGIRVASLDLPSPAYSLAWSPNGYELAAGAFDNNIYLFDAANGGRRTGTFSGHRQEVTQVLFTPSGDRIVSTSLDKTIRLWSLSALTQEVVSNGYGSEPALRFSLNGEQLATTAAGARAYFFSIHDASAICRTYVNGRPIGRATLVGGLAFSPDGDTVATSTYEGIDLWDITSGRLRGSYDLDVDFEKSVRFGNTPSSLIIGSRKSGLAEYEITNKGTYSSLQFRRTLDREPGFIFSNSPSGDGDLMGLTSSKGGVARILNLKTGVELLRINQLPDVWDLAISPNQKYFSLTFSAQAEPGSAFTQIWSLPDQKKIASIPGGQAGMARFSRDSRWVKISGRRETEQLYDLIAMKLRPDLRCPGSNPVFHPRKDLIATTISDPAITKIRLWTIGHGDECDLESPLLTCSSYRLAFSPDGTRLAAHSSNNVLLIWNLELLKHSFNKSGFRWD